MKKVTSIENTANQQSAILLMELIDNFYLSHHIGNQQMELCFSSSSTKLINTLITQRKNCCNNYQFSYHSEEGINTITIRVEDPSDWLNLYSKVTAQINKP